MRKFSKSASSQKQKFIVNKYIDFHSFILSSPLWSRSYQCYQKLQWGTKKQEREFSIISCILRTVFEDRDNIVQSSWNHCGIILLEVQKSRPLNSNFFWNRKHKWHVSSVIFLHSIIHLTSGVCSITSKAWGKICINYWLKTLFCHATILISYKLCFALGFIKANKL